jgi:hypothetical protein
VSDLECKTVVIIIPSTQKYSGQLCWLLCWDQTTHHSLSGNMWLFLWYQSHLLPLIVAFQHNYAPLCLVNYNKQDNYPGKWNLINFYRLMESVYEVYDGCRRNGYDLFVQYQQSSVNQPLFYRCFSHHLTVSLPFWVLICANEHHKQLFLPGMGYHSHKNYHSEMLSHWMWAQLLDIIHGQSMLFD